MRRAVLALLGVVLALRVAYADEGDAPTKPSYRVVVDRVEHEPAAIGGTRLALTLTALTLQGQLIDLSDSKAITIKTYLGGSELKAPYALGTFAGTKEALAIVFVVQSTVEYTEVLPVIADTLDNTLLAALDENVTQIAILPYGETIGNGKLVTMKSGRTKAAALANDGSTGDPALLETVERGLSLLKRAKTDPEGQALRKLIVVISDGRDRNGDRERVTRLGNRAAKEGVRIDSMAYAPTDQRRPLLLLGELSRRSFGTFRWLQRGKADSWQPAFEQLRDEILKQYVLTYFLTADQDPSGKKLKIETTGRVAATSNEIKVPEATCNGEACAGYCTGSVCAVPKGPNKRGIFGWILLVGGIAVGAVLLIGLVGFVMSKRAPRIPLPPGVVMPGKAPVLAAPGAAPGMAAPVAAQPMAVPTGPQFMFTSGPRAGQRIGLRHGLTIGKDASNDVVNDDGFTSSAHAQIAMDGTGTVWLIDRGSTNGTYVNGNKIQQQALVHGHAVKIGSTEFQYLQS